MSEEQPVAPPVGQPVAQPRRRRWLPLMLAGTLAALAIGTGAALAVITDEDEPPADLSAVVVYDDLPTTHVTEPHAYEQAPPPGGPHFPAWLECGVYADPVPDEMAVHDLEHGTFWFAYDPDALSDGEIDRLAAALPDNGIMAPYVDPSAPVVVTVWERQLALTGVDDPRLALFLAEYAGGTTAPEPMASCAGGITESEISAFLGDVQPS